jgi:hypothetical protein
MREANLLSTLVLTLLLLVGLFFFLRASVKDRTEEAQLAFASCAEVVSANLRRYLEGRAYRLVQEGDALIFCGTVAPSRFLALFLSVLALLGLVCLALVLSTLVPQSGWLLAVLPLASPAAGLFYWRRARRLEQVVAHIRNTDSGSVLRIQAHRDEILALKDSLTVRHG